MSHCSVMPGEFGLVEGHWVVAVDVVHIFHHDLSKFQRDWCCVGGPVEPSYLSGVPESWFWSTSSGFKKSNWSIPIGIAPFEVWKVVVTDDISIEVFVAINLWNSLKNRWSFGYIQVEFREFFQSSRNSILPLRMKLGDCHSSSPRT